MLADVKVISKKLLKKLLALILKKLYISKMVWWFMLKLFPILYVILIDEKLCTNNDEKDREKRDNIMWLQIAKMAISLNIVVA